MSLLHVTSKTCQLNGCKWQELEADRWQPMKLLRRKKVQLRVLAVLCCGEGGVVVSHSGQARKRNMFNQNTRFPSIPSF